MIEIDEQGQKISEVDIALLEDEFGARCPMIIADFFY